MTFALRKLKEKTLFTLTIENNDKMIAEVGWIRVET